MCIYGEQWQNLKISLILRSPITELTKLNIVLRLLITHSLYSQCPLIPNS